MMSRDSLYIPVGTETTNLRLVRIFENERRDSLYIPVGTETIKRDRHSITYDTSRQPLHPGRD